MESVCARLCVCFNLFLCLYLPLYLLKIGGLTDTTNSSSTLLGLFHFLPLSGRESSISHYPYCLYLFHQFPNTWTILAATTGSASGSFPQHASAPTLLGLGATSASSVDRILMLLVLLFPAPPGHHPAAQTPPDLVRLQYPTPGCPSLRISFPFCSGSTIPSSSPPPCPHPQNAPTQVPFSHCPRVGAHSSCSQLVHLWTFFIKSMKAEAK